MTGVPRDRGWAWMTVLGAGICMFLVVGGFKTIGILFVEFRLAFQGSAAMTAAFMGLTTCCMSLFAPPVSILGERRTYRFAVMIGGVLCALGMFLSAFATNIYFVIFVFGTLTGISYAFMFAPSLVLLSMYFDKRRSLANGLAMAGASVGQLLIPQVLNLLLKEYNLMWTLIIYSAICLHGVLAGALLRPVSLYGQGSAGSEVKVTVKGDGDDADVPNGKDTIKCESETTDRDESRNHCGQDGGTGEGQKGQSQGQTETTNTAEATLQNSHKKETLDSDDTSIATVTFDPNQKRTSCQRFASWVCELYDWSLFTNFLFLAYLLGIMLGNVGYLNPFQLIPPHAADIGISSDDTATLLSIIGAFDLFGRVFGGWFADLGLIKRNNLMALSVIFTGVSLVVYTFIQNYPALLAFCVILGLIGGFYVSLMAVVCIDFVGLDKFGSAFSLTVLFMGLTNTGTPILLGYIRDSTGSYRGALVLCGLLMVVGGFAFASEPCARNLQKRWENRKKTAAKREPSQPESDALVKHTPDTVKEV